MVAAKPEIVAEGMSLALIAELRETYVIHDTQRAADRAAALAAAANATVAVRGALGIMDAETIAALPKLGLIACLGAGYDAVDLAVAKARGIVVTHAPGITDRCVADMALGLMIATMRRIVDGDRFVRDGRWMKAPYPQTHRVSGSRLGILGLGRIGMEIAKRAAAFDMEIAYTNRRVRGDVPYRFEPSLMALAGWADILVLALPGGPETNHQVDAAVLAALGPQGILINIARGSVVDEQALAEALVAGRLGGAGLDVYVEEPCLPTALLGLPNVVLTPHRAGATHETMNDITAFLKANLARFFRGEPVLAHVPLP